MFGLCLTCASAWGHDIPNQRVDRSIQVTLSPGQLRIDYEVSLSELTLTQDLRSLIGSLPGGSRDRWLDEFGKITGPLNAKGFFIAVDRRPIELGYQSFDLKLEEHPRYTFHLEAALPDSGKLEIYDTNYATSEGTSRLAIRCRDGSRISGDSLPTEVAEIPIRPVWEMTDEEELRSKRVVVSYTSASRISEGEEGSKGSAARPALRVKPDSTLPPKQMAPRLSDFLDRNRGWSLPGVLLLSAALGTLHSLQPGHGKTLVSAIALRPDVSWSSPVLLALTTGVVHTMVVLLVGAGIWFAGTSRVEGIHVGLARTAGFLIAAAGFWRIGRFLGGHGEHPPEEGQPAIETPGTLELMSLGFSGGMVPCWDAVGLIVLAGALGQLALGVACVVAFGLGMSFALAGLAMLASRFRAILMTNSAFPRLEQWLGVATGFFLAGVGSLLFF